MKTDHYNELSEEESERLALLIEECAEVIQAATKVLRHGYASQWPVRSGPTNRESLSKELGHLRTATELMLNQGDVNGVQIADSALAKHETISRWLHHQ